MMFTGIVEELGAVAAIDRDDASARLRIACATVVEGVDVGDSIAVNGCCLTVTTLDAEGFAADLMAETLRATSLGGLAVGDPVNLERAVAVGDRLGGHIVAGHVDAAGRVVDRREEPGTVWLEIAAPADVAPFLAPKGSVTVDGVSLTVVEVADDADGDGARFTVGLIPHTLTVTTLGSRRVGDDVNLEADVVARYTARLLATTTEDGR